MDQGLHQVCLPSTSPTICTHAGHTYPGTHEGAAVAILESPLPASSSSPDDNSDEETQKVFGVARLIQVSLSPVLTLLDLTMRFPGYPLDDGKNTATISAGAGASTSSSTVSCVKDESSSSSSTSTPPPKEDNNNPSYTLYISTTGDLSSPPTTTGPPLHTLSTTLRPDSDGYADLFLELELNLWEIVGRGLVLEETKAVEARNKAKGDGDVVKEREDRAREVMGGRGRLGILAGVIARSAGGMCT